MSIPLDRLYHYIEAISKKIYNGDVVIYRFFPHGAKKITNLIRLQPEINILNMFSPEVICNDQEPLNYDYYQHVDVFDHSDTTLPPSDLIPEMAHLLKQDNIQLPRQNFRYTHNFHDHCLLLHSEKRSENLEKYKADDFATVYYWCHAVIALDWFRFAEHEVFNKNSKKSKTFLIYNRAWSGTREYRLKFTEHLIGLGLANSCKMNINPVEPELGIHYNQHKFINPTWQPGTILENFFPISDASSHYSADFDIEDYKATDIEVVLETLFDDDRLHLTEKSLRPIACGQPFILAATHGSLEYLRSYGFKTFMHIWDERYDLIEDPEERLMSIADLMKQISNWSPQDRERNLAQARAIAEYNRQHFFSKEFSAHLEFELVENITSGLEILKNNNTGRRFFNFYNALIQSPGLEAIIHSREFWTKLLEKVIHIL